MKSHSALLSESELKKFLASWTIKFSRFAPKCKSSGEAAFVLGFDIPRSDFTLVSNRICEDEKILTVLKTQIFLSPWQTRDAKRHSVTYLKIIKTDVDSLGNLFEDVLGYSIIKET